MRHIWNSNGVFEVDTLSERETDCFGRLTLESVQSTCICNLVCDISIIGLCSLELVSLFHSMNSFNI